MKQKLLVCWQPDDDCPQFACPHHEREGIILVVDSHEVEDTAILAAYRQWGVECAHHLSGDYAFLLWDTPRALLLAARSITGRCPLYVATRGTCGLWCASDPTSLLAHGVPAAWDNRWIAHWLVQSEDHWRSSPWQAITPLLPGHCLVAQHGQVQITPCWSPPKRSHPSALSFEDAAAQFRDLLLQGLSTRLRGQEPCSFDCSGGLDSTSLTAMVAFLQEQGKLDLGTIHAYHGYSQEYPEEDARAYLADLVRRYPAITPHFIAFDRLRSVSLEVEHRTYPTLRSVLMPAYPAEVEQQLRVQGSTVHVSGGYGDQLFTPTIRALWQQPVSRWPADLWRWRAFRSPFLVGAYAWLMERAARKRRPLPAWIEPEAAAIVEKHLAEQEMFMRAWIPDPFQRALLRSVWHDQSLLTSDFGRKVSSQERLFPYLDQPLLEFLCQCPTPWLMAPGPGARKGLLREAMRGILPEAVQRRGDKGNATRVIAAWSKQQSTTLKTLVNNAKPLPLLDQEGLLTAIARMSYGDCRDQRFVYHALALSVCTERR